MDIVKYGDAEASSDLDYLSNEELIKRAESGDALACYNLGCTYYIGGRGYDVDYDKCEKWLLKAANKGYIIAQCELGKFYLEDQGGKPRNRNEAYKWFRKAAEGGNANAQFMMGSRYFDGEPKNEEDREEAKRWFKKAAEKDYIWANGQLAIISIEEENYDLAFQYAEIIAKQGIPMGQYLLGALYGMEELSFYDIKKHEFWMLLSAEGGFPTAQYYMGTFYENALGGVTKMDEAIRWYKIAAENGDEDAKEALKRLGK